MTAALTEKRIESIDVAKGIGIALVVFGHIVKLGSPVAVSVYSFHMPLFYILSGYLMPGKVSIKSYQKRMVLLLVNFISFSLIGLFFTLLIPDWRKELSLIKLLYYVFYHGQPEVLHVGQLWFLISMIWSVSLFYLLHSLFSKYDFICLPISFAIALFSIIVSKNNICLNFEDLQFDLPFKILPGMCSVFFLELGFQFKKYNLLSKIHNIKKPILFFCSLFFFAITLIISQINGMVNLCECKYNNVFYYFLTSISGSLGVIIISCLIGGLAGRILGFYGKNSMCVFSIHSLLLALYAKIMSLIFGIQMWTFMCEIVPVGIIGVIFVMSAVVPIVFLYDRTIRKLINGINSRITKKAQTGNNP